MMGRDIARQAKKPSGKHPYAAIEHRVIDSTAYADLSHSACRLLTIMARQLTKDNNGQLHASFAWCREHGIGSEHTLRNAIADLIEHGFLYRTRSHGANGAWARYAVTWLPIKDRDGLFLDGFVPCAWRNWEPPRKKTTRPKLQDQSSRNCSFNAENPAETAGTHPAETADYELIPVGVAGAAPRIGIGRRMNRRRRHITSPHAIRLSLVTDRGQLRLAA